MKLDRIELKLSCDICGKRKESLASSFCKACRAEMDHEHVQSEAAFMLDYDIFLQTGTVPERYK